MTSVNLLRGRRPVLRPLMGLGYAGLLVSREATQQEKRAQRIEGVLSPHMRAHRIELSAFIQTPTVEHPLGIRPHGRPVRLRSRAGWSAIRCSGGWF